jgi:hypothetical protein
MVVREEREVIRGGNKELRRWRLQPDWLWRGGQSSGKTKARGRREKNTGY